MMWTVVKPLARPLTALLVLFSVAAHADDGIPLTEAMPFVSARTVFGTAFEEHVDTILPLGGGEYLAGGYRRFAFTGDAADEIATVWSIADGTGNPIWSAKFGRSMVEQLWSRPDGIGVFYLDGSRFIPDRVNLLVLDRQGRELRRQAVSRPMAQAFRVVPLVDDGVLVVGTSREDQITRTGSSAWIVRLSPAWEPVFTRLFRGGEVTAAVDAVELPSGDFVIVGDNRLYANTSKQKAWAARLTGSGKIVWQKEFPGDGFRRVARRADDMLVALGEKDQRLLLTVIDENGASLDQKIIGEPATSPTELLPLADGSIVILGQIYRVREKPPIPSEGFVLTLDEALRQKAGISFKDDSCRYLTDMRLFHGRLVIAADADRPAPNPKEFSLPDVCVMEADFGR